MKKFLYVFFICSFLLSCAGTNDILDDDRKETENPEEELVRLNLYTNNGNGNIFELMTFGISTGKPFSIGDLTEAYDSIVWSVADIKGSYRIFESTPPNANVHLQWSHNFFLPGEYKTFLTGYKDNTIIHQDTLPISVSDQKDFLEYNWKDITGSSKSTKGMQMCFQKSMFLVRVII